VIQVIQKPVCVTSFVTRISLVDEKIVKSGEAGKYGIMIRQIINNGARLDEKVFDVSINMVYERRTGVSHPSGFINETLKSMCCKNVYVICNFMRIV